MASNLPAAWRGRSAWRVLDTHFCDGTNFFATWQTWAADAHAPALLHYVAIAPQARGRDALLRTLAGFAGLRHQAADLQRQWFGLLPGFHRLALHDARLLLTLCVGPLQTMLREQRFVADTVYLHSIAPDHTEPPWDRWSIKALTRLCRSGTALAAPGLTAQLRTELAQAGFAIEVAAHTPGATPPSTPDNIASGSYQPRVRVAQARESWRRTPVAVSSCVVIGAGLAGAAAAAALALRGWRVTVLDAAATPASEGSALPVGLLAPQLSRDDSTRSRLSRAGVRQTLQACEARLHQGEDWACTGVAELAIDGPPSMPTDWPAPAQEWSRIGLPDHDDARWRGQVSKPDQAIWHRAGGWIKPARLIASLLRHARIEFVGTSPVQAIRHVAGEWQLLNQDHHVLASAPQLVIAAAADSPWLVGLAASAWPERPIARLANMQTVAGQVSWAAHDGDSDMFAPFPVNGAGSVVAHVAFNGALSWFVGATYEPTTALDTAQAHAENLARLARLLPAVAELTAARFAAATVSAWRGIRCTTADRLPAVGALDAEAGLWVSTGMGSRGLTYAILCAELLAAELGHEPLPIEASLLKTLSATRARLLRQQ